MDWLYYFTMGMITGFFSARTNYNKKPKIYLSTEDDGWIFIKDQPVPDEYFEDGDVDELFLTDGVNISCTWRPKCNRQGQVVFGYGDKVAVAWRPQLQPPRKKNG